MTLEPHLRRAMAPVDPNDGFAERVLGRIDREHGRRAPVPVSGRRMTDRLPWSRAGLALAASLLVAVAGSAGWLQQQRRAEGERARMQLIEALKVTSASLGTVSQRLARVGSARLDIGGAGL